MTDVRLGVQPDVIADFCRRWKIAEFALFGSILREEFSPASDVDVLVTFAPDARPSLLDYAAAKEELAALIGRKVDMIDRPSLERHHNPWLRQSILSDARVIYRAA